MTAVLTLVEERPPDSAWLDRHLVVRADPGESWVGVRVTAESVGPARSEAIVLTPEQARTVEDFLANQRLAREASKETQ